jgi:cytochrome P450 family 4
MIAMHGNVQQRLVEEINEVFGENKDLIIDHEKLSELKYVEQCIKETLRLFSPATGKLIYLVIKRI